MSFPLTLPGWLPSGYSTESAPPPDPPAPTPIVSATVGGPADIDEWGSWKWPEDVYPESYTLLPQSHTLGQESPLTRKRRHVRLVGDRWVYEISFRHNRVRNQRMEALLARLRGPVGIVALWDFDRETPLGPNQDISVLPGTRFDDDTGFTDGTQFAGGPAGLTVYGAWERGAESILVYGFPQNTTQLVGADQVGIAGRLYRLTRDAPANGYGIARFYLHRGLLASIAHETPVVTYRPTSPFQLVDDDQSARARTARGLPSINLRFLEVL